MKVYMTVVNDDKHVSFSGYLDDSLTESEMFKAAREECRDKFFDTYPNGRTFSNHSVVFYKTFGGE